MKTQTVRQTMSHGSDRAAPVWTQVYPAQVAHHNLGGHVGRGGGYRWQSLLSMHFLTSVLKSIEPRIDDDFVDRLNYYYTSGVIIMMAILVSAKQYAGHPIECWVPAQFTKAMEQYTENFCWIQNTYWVPFDDFIPQRSDEREERQIGYYQWVPFVLAIEALMFYIPTSVWRFMNAQSGINILGVLELACDSRNIEPQNRLYTVNVLARHIDDALRFQRDFGRKERSVYLWAFIRIGKFYGAYVTLMYCFVKFLYFINVFGQFFLLNRFLANENTQFLGAHVVWNLLQGVEWQNSGVFPRVTLCDFDIRVLGNVHRHTVQCVLVINMFTEKIFLFLWLWFLFLTLLTFVNMAYWLLTILLPSLRLRFIQRCLEFSDAPPDPQKDGKHLDKFVNNYLRPDGIFILRMIFNHSGNIMCNEIAFSLWTRYRELHKSPKAMLVGAIDSLTKIHPQANEKQQQQQQAQAAACNPSTEMISAGGGGPTGGETPPQQRSRSSTPMAPQNRAQRSPKKKVMQLPPALASIPPPSASQKLKSRSSFDSGEKFPADELSSDLQSLDFRKNERLLIVVLITEVGMATVVQLRVWKKLRLVFRNSLHRSSSLLMESRGPSAVMPDEPRRLRVRPEARNNYQLSLRGCGVAVLLNGSKKNQPLKTNGALDKNLLKIHNSRNMEKRHSFKSDQPTIITCRKKQNCSLNEAVVALENGKVNSAKVITPLCLDKLTDDEEDTGCEWNCPPLVHRKNGCSNEKKNLLKTDSARCCSSAVGACESKRKNCRMSNFCSSSSSINHIPDDRHGQAQDVSSSSVPRRNTSSQLRNDPLLLPRGCSEIPLQERREMLSAIRLAIFDLQLKLDHLPVRSDTTALRLTKDHLESRIVQLEKAQATFSKRKDDDSDGDDDNNGVVS
ncbi:Innexin unc-7 [Trichinella britovi]|uniref:Innexin n=1 Tax=Trichinella britovi TaxID=45882 RepID=A0A0V1CJV8_TRIBR|nr:Innexin unc-7 [Trichinella britovi]